MPLRCDNGIQGRAGGGLSLDIPISKARRGIETKPERSFSFPHKGWADRELWLFSQIPSQPLPVFTYLLGF